MTSGPAPPYLPGTSLTTARRKDGDHGLRLHTLLSIVSLSGRISSAMLSSVCIFTASSSRSFQCSSIIILQASMTHLISHHLVRDLLQFSHMIAAIRVPSAQFIIKIVSICVQYQGYFDPDIIGPFFHNYIICKTQAQR